jgi:hypothetical protein
VKSSIEKGTIKKCFRAVTRNPPPKTKELPHFETAPKQQNHALHQRQNMRKTSRTQFKAKGYRKKYKANVSHKHFKTYVYHKSSKVKGLPQENMRQPLSYINAFLHFNVIS